MSLPADESLSTRSVWRWLLYALVGLIFGLVLLAATAPASWLAWGLAKYSGNALSLLVPTGSAWQGEGTLVLQGEHAPPLSLGAVRWRINPFWAVIGELPLSLQSAGVKPLPLATIIFTTDGARAQSMDVTLPAAAISYFFPSAMFLKVGGDIRIISPDIAISNGTIHGSAEIQWRSASISLTSVKPLGDYRLHLTGEGRTLVGRIETPRGALLLSGDGRWDLETGTLVVNGIARPLAHLASLEPFLQLLGQDQGGGLRSFMVQTHVLMAF